MSMNDATFHYNGEHLIEVSLGTHPLYLHVIWFIKNRVLPQLTE